MEGSDVLPLLFATLRFAAERHRDHRRKEIEAPPFINHPIEVAELLVRVGGVTDLVTLQGALLHDTLEDGAATAREIEELFGAEVLRVVEEVTDDKRLAREARKREQVERTPRLSERARLIRIADKISNVRSIAHAPPARWPLERRLDYLDWSERVVAGCRGCNPALEALYDRVGEECRRRLLAQDAGAGSDGRRSP